MIETIAMCAVLVLGGISLWMQLDLRERMKYSHLSHHCKTLLTSLACTALMVVMGLVYVLVKHVRVVA